MGTRRFTRRRYTLDRSVGTNADIPLNHHQVPRNLGYILADVIAAKSDGHVRAPLHKWALHPSIGISLGRQFRQPVCLLAPFS